MSASLLNTNSPLGVLVIVGFMLVSATVGIAIMAIVFSALLQFVFDLRGDRDEELLAAAAAADDTGD
ncbi:MAG: hypothetical protein U0U69_13615 [Acidimicrobiia bacterium]